MRKFSLSGAVLVALLLAGCKSDHEKVMGGLAEKLNTLASILKTITDADSAKSATPKLQSAAADLKSLSEQFKALSKPSPDEEKRLNDKYRKEISAAANRVKAEGDRIEKSLALMTPEVRAALQSIR